VEGGKTKVRRPRMSYLEDRENDLRELKVKRGKIYRKAWAYFLRMHKSLEDLGHKGVCK
jgi:hypothetical protein